MQVARTKENLNKCRCMHCPSYSMECKIKAFPQNLLKMTSDLKEVSHYEKMFCAFEKSRCVDTDKGCICKSCPIYEEYQLINMDYCLKTGGEKKDF